jgi:phosphatidylglycerol---prolipoprotein diacylglyceryl transferase
MDGTGTKNSYAKTSQPFLVAQFLQLGPLKIRFYSLTMVTAIIAGYLMGRLQLKRLRFPELEKSGVSKDVFYDDLAFWVIIFAFLGARAFHVVTDFELYRNNLLGVFEVWKGGIGIYGAIIAGAATIYYFAKKYKIPFLKLTDLVALGMPLSQAIGRLGNYFNYEAFGVPTSLPWKMFVPERFRSAGFEGFAYYHPTFLYEMIWNLLLFGVLYIYAKNKLWKEGNVRYGVLTALYLGGYGFGRLFIEALRIDSSYLGIFRVNQLVSVLLIVASLGIIYRYAPQTDQ